MTCRLLVLREGAGSIIDYWAATRADCIEYANLWRWAGHGVWMEFFK
jgi:hypothetical protein